MQKISFDIDQWNRLFPFFILINEEMDIVAVGDALNKLIPKNIQKKFSNIFEFNQPDIEVIDFNSIRDENNEMVILKLLNQADGVLLRGQFEFLTASNQIIFLGTPVKASIDELSTRQSMVVGNQQLGSGLTLTTISQSESIAEKIRQSEERWKFALEGSGAGIWEYNFQTEALFFSVQYEKMLGYTKDELENNSTIWPAIIHPDDFKHFKEYDLEYEQGIRTSHKKEYRIKRKDGTYIWVLDRGMLISKTNDGRSLRLIGTHTDITEKKLAENKLESQRIFYEQVLNKIPSDIVVFDKDHRYLFINPIAIKDPELRKWMIGKKDEDYCALRNKPDHIVEGRRGIFNKVLASNKLYAWEETLQNAENETEYHLRNMLPVLDSNGEVEMVIGYGVNISERKKIEEKIRINEKRYRDLFNYSQALICTHDKNGIILSVNPSICEALGYSRDEMVGNSLLQFVPIKLEEFQQTEYFDLLWAEGKRNGVIPAIHKNGKKIFLLFQNYLVEETGAEPYVIGFAQDITDRIYAEKELQIAKLKTEEVSRAKEIFLANMSHEIRTPMNGILGVANLLSKTIMNSQQNSYLKLIKESANNLLLIVNDVLDIEKIGSGKIEFEQSAFLLFENLQKSIQAFQYKAEEKGLQLTIDCSLNKHLVLIGDSYRLHQILNNLLNNALKFTSKGRVSLQVYKISSEADALIIGFTIEDTGIGIEANKLETVFDPFVQASSDTTRKFGGTGLGLSICKNLVEMQGGSIAVDSVLNQGTKFHFQIPYKLGNIEMVALEDKLPDDYKQLGNKKILIVEDVELNYFIASQILESWGMEVAIAINGVEAVDMVKSSSFDLVLMDIHMPEMDGIEATRIIRKMEGEKFNKIPIIALTANALKGDNQLFFEVGMNDYITKPFTEEKLYTVISRFLQPSDKPIFQKKNDIILDNSTEILPFTNSLDEVLLYDLTMVEEIGKDNPSFLPKMVFLFLDQVSEDLMNMNHATVEQDWMTVSRLAHRMKPSIEGMGIISLRESIKTVENNTKKIDTIVPSQIIDLVTEITVVLEKVFAQLRKAFIEKPTDNW
ncbi:MAG: PAS domain S-box protein [Sediminibacterium sp.]